MKRFKIAGITLLEIMLVLAIAAMIIIMSVRYYQATTESEQTTSLMQQIQAISAAADQISEGTGNYTNATQASVSALIPNGLATPWGPNTIGIVPSQSYIQVTISSLPTNICSAISQELKNLGGNYNVTSSSCGTSVIYTYTSIQGGGSKTNPSA